ncbi:MAG: hypothetical protein JXR25_02710 [Pontiellaceae bacterium]|nr:hypothetical protein [Pontiellaceae bacterium]MBN2783714.1 hypothetical protein [Pontiellaceae bacterium]
MKSVKEVFFLLVAMCMAAAVANASTVISYTSSASPASAPDGNENSVDVWTVTGDGGNYLSGTYDGDPHVWAIWDAGDTEQGTYATHTFAGGALEVGQSVSIDYSNANIDSGKRVGIRLLGGTTTEVEFGFLGGEQDYSHFDTGTNEFLSVYKEWDGGDLFQVVFTLTDVDAYSMSVTRGSNSGDDPSVGDESDFWTGTFTGSAIDGIQIYTEGGWGSDQYFDNLAILPDATSPQFQNFVPGYGSLTASAASPVGVEVVYGAYTISSNDVTMLLDGTEVSPSFALGSNSLIMSYQPAVEFAPGSVHDVEVNLVDEHSTPYSSSWTFTVDTYPSLPAIYAESTNGIVSVSGGGSGSAIWTSANGWLSDNYGDASTNTLYSRFTMKFDDVNGETGGGGAYGGMHFYRGGKEIMLIGNGWVSTNWSIDVENTIVTNLTPAVPVVLGEWHTMVSKIEFVDGTNDNVTIWLDPDFSLPEDDAVNAGKAFSFSHNVSFDSVHLRCGDGTAASEFTNIVMAATAEGVGFSDTVPESFIYILPMGGSNLEISWTGSGTLQETPSLTEEWINSANQDNPQTRPATNSAAFFRIKL